MLACQSFLVTKLLISCILYFVGRFLIGLGFQLSRTEIEVGLKETSVEWIGEVSSEMAQQFEKQLRQWSSGTFVGHWVDRNCQNQREFVYRFSLFPAYIYLIFPKLNLIPVWRLRESHKKLRATHRQFSLPSPSHHCQIPERRSYP